MKRRAFLAMGMVAASSVYLSAQSEEEVFLELFSNEWGVIETTLEHMFPHQSVLPSAASIGLLSFVRETLAHPSYDKDIRTFVLEGAQTLYAQTNGTFLTMDTAAKEKVLRTYEKNRSGRQWLQRIMILGMEGMFGDPIYGANSNEVGWNALKTSGGNPRPKTRYIAL